MPDTQTTTDPLAARLTEVRKPYLLAALEKVLARHQPGRLVVLGALCPKHEAHRYFSITSAEAAGVEACQECAATVYTSCVGCGPQVRLDSCPDRADISAALLGSGTAPAGEGADHA